jgi:DNA-binding transcriptional regulator YdaS (Cro superfamily)
MLKETAVQHFGGAAALARALGRTPSAVTEWGEIIPEGMAYKIQVITGGLLQVDQSMYQKKEKAPQ